MKKVSFLTFLTLISAGFLSRTQAAEEDTYCYLQASGLYELLPLYFVD